VNAKQIPTETLYLRVEQAFLLYFPSGSEADEFLPAGTIAHFEDYARTRAILKTTWKGEACFLWLPWSRLRDWETKTDIARRFEKGRQSGSSARALFREMYLDTCAELSIETEVGVYGGDENERQNGGSDDQGGGFFAFGGGY
jgi:hypothetical protein